MILSSVQELRNVYQLSYYLNTELGHGIAHATETEANEVCSIILVLDFKLQLEFRISNSFSKKVFISHLQDFF